jgi:tetratricopeptide (TPR) repeat protein
MDVERYLADDPVQACPPSVSYRLRKFVRRNRVGLSIVGLILFFIAVLGGGIGWVVRDRAAGATKAKQAEATRLARVEGQARAELDMARTLLVEKKLAEARQKLAEAVAHIGNDRSALSDLAADVEAVAAALNRFLQFMDLINRAHQAEITPVSEAELVADVSRSRASRFRTVSNWARRPAVAVPLLFQALECYGVLEREDWSSVLDASLLGREQGPEIRRAVYEELLWLTTDILGRKEGHRTAEPLSPSAAAQQALAYLAKAETAHPPTLALYTLRARCRKTLGDVTAAEADQKLADNTPATMALDHYLRGQAAYYAKQLTEGVRAFEAALRLEPTHYWSMVWLGWSLCDLGKGPEDFTEATRVFTGCIMKRPDHAHAYYCRANAYAKLRRYQEAVADHSMAIQLDPTFEPAWSNRGNVYLERGQPGDAVVDLSRAIELEPNAVNAWTSRGTAYLRLDQLNKAVADYSRAIELTPRDAKVWHNRGITYARLGKSKEALADLNRAVELGPTHALRWNSRATVFLDLGEPEKARADYDRAIKLDPELALAWSNRGSAYRQLGQYDKSLADHSRAIELDPEDAVSWMNRSATYLEMRQPDKAIADCDRAIELDAKLASAWSNRGGAYVHLRRYEKAIADLTKAIELGSKGIEPWYNRGLAYDELGRHEKAAADFTKVIELRPKEADAWFRRGEDFYKLGQHEKAVADYTKLIELEPNDSEAWLSLGRPHYKLGQYDKVVADISKAIKLGLSADDLVRAYVLRAAAYSQLSRYEQSLKDYEAALTKSPANAAVLNEFAWMLANCPEIKLRDPKRAVELATKAVQLAPKAGGYWNTLGVAHYRAGDSKAALTAFEKSLELRPGDAFDFFFLAMAHKKLGHDEEARKYYNQAIQWLDKSKAALEKDKSRGEELRHLRNEAEGVLEFGKK